MNQQKNNIDFSAELLPRYADALINDHSFNFKHAANGTLSKGNCPSCKKPTLFGNTKRPWQIKCNSYDKCGYEDTTANLYPDIAEDFIASLKNDTTNPNADADVYMKYKRGLPVAGWYSQGHFNKDGINTPTVRFMIHAENGVFWERFIDTPRDLKRRHHMGGKYRKLNPNDPDFKELDGTLVKGLWWSPPNQIINEGDTVYLVEGIFHAIALSLSGFKACAIIGASYFPTIAIKPYLSKNILWVWALDFDKTGLAYMAKHMARLSKMGELSTMALTGESKLDWDDLYKNKILSKENPEFMAECMHRGQMHLAKTPTRKAFLHFRKTESFYFVIDHNNALFSVSMKLDKEVTVADLKEIEASEEYNNYKTPAAFVSNSKVIPISSCNPQFLYAERDQLTDELSYFMRVDFQNGAPRIQKRFDSKLMESKSSFHNALASTITGAAFYGSANDFRYMHSRWFRSKEACQEVTTVSFMGYDKGFGGYVFDEYGIKDGQYLAKNELGLIQLDNARIKSSLSDVNFVIPNREAKLDWFDEAHKAFGINGLVTMAHWFGCFFSEQIREYCGQYGFLEMNGPPNTGKSFLLEFLWKASGRSQPYEGINPLKYSPVGRARAMMKLAGMPMVMLEGDVEISKYTFDIDEMKDALNGRAIRGVGVKTSDNRTIEPLFKCGLIVAQNKPVECDAPMISRFVQLEFNRAHFSPEGEMILRKFKDMPFEDAAQFGYQSMINEKQIMASIIKNYEELLPDFRGIKKVTTPRIQELHAMTCACFFAMEIIFGPSVAKLKTEIKNYLGRRAIDREKRMNGDHPDVENFWSVYELINKSDRDSIEYLNHSKDPELIAININEVASRARQQYHNLPLEKDLKKLLLDSKKYKYDSTKGVKSNITNKTKYCMVFVKPKEMSEGSAN